MKGVKTLLCGKSDKPMTDKDRMLLSPWQKWKEYHRFPIKIVLQVVVLAFVSAQLYYMTDYYPAFSRSSFDTFEYFFLPDSDDHNLYTIEEVLLHFNTSVSKYYELDGITLGLFSYVNDSGGLPSSPVMAVSSYDAHMDNTQYNLTLLNPFGPFNGTTYDLRSKFRNLKGISIFYLFQSKETVFATHTVPTRITVTIHYNLIGGVLSPYLKMNRIYVGGTLFSFESWLLIIMMLLSSFSAVLSAKRVWMGYVVYSRCKKKFEELSLETIQRYFAATKVFPVCETWDSIPFSVKFQFFSSWHMFSIFGDLFILIASVLQLTTSFGISDGEWARLLFGLGILFLCTNMTKYLEYNPAFYTLILTLKTSFNKITKFFISTMPTFFGYILCGVVVFSPYSVKFQNVDETAVTLFALLNGDDIHATFDHLQEVYPITTFARIYLYTFILLFITAVLNLFIFIIEDAYHLAKVLTTPDRDQPGEDSLDHDSLLLWDSLQRMFTLRRLFELLEVADDPSQLPPLPASAPSPTVPSSPSQSPNNTPPSSPLLPKAQITPITPKPKRTSRSPSASPTKLAQSNPHFPPNTPQPFSLPQRTLSSVQSRTGLQSSTPHARKNKQLMNVLEKHHAKFVTQIKRQMEIKQREFMDSLKQDLEIYL